MSKEEGDCGCQDQKQPAAEPAVGTPVELTAREIEIYQAGQCFGASQTLRQIAEQLNQLSQKLNSNAKLQAEAGQKFIDRALQNPPKASAGGKARRRLANAIEALLGDSG